MQERQTYFTQELPSQAQVAVFARACILFAHRHDRLERMSSGAYRIGPMSHYSPPELTEGQPWGFLYKDTCTVSVLLDEALHIPRLQIVRGLIAEDHGSNAGLLRSVYTYQADSDSRTLVSTQKFTQGFKGEQRSGESPLLSDINLDNVQVPSDISERLALDVEMEMVTADDFEQLTGTVHDKMQKIDSEERAYTETRKGTYVSYFDW